MSVSGLCKGVGMSRQNFYKARNVSQTQAG